MLLSRVWQQDIASANVPVPVPVPVNLGIGPMISQEFPGSCSDLTFCKTHNHHTIPHNTYIVVLLVVHLHQLWHRVSLRVAPARLCAHTSMVRAAAWVPHFCGRLSAAPQLQRVNHNKRASPVRRFQRTRAVSARGVGAPHARIKSGLGRHGPRPLAGAPAAAVPRRHPRGTFWLSCPSSSAHAVCNG